MSDDSAIESAPRRAWRLPMFGRDPAEKHRSATPLELFFDLCFVVAIAQAAAELHHALAENHAATGVPSYLTVFFAIWWAWMNFTWFASAYDNDDVPYRIAAMAQITGALILAAGVPRAFEEHDFDVVFFGYAVMRLGLVALWLRAARTDRARRTTALRFAAGLTFVMGGWSVMLLTGHWPLWGWWLMAAAELAVPIWAERANMTPWHPHHIAERYGLFTTPASTSHRPDTPGAASRRRGPGARLDGHVGTRPDHRAGAHRRRRSLRFHCPDTPHHVTCGAARPPAFTACRAGRSLVPRRCPASP